MHTYCIYISFQLECLGKRPLFKYINTPHKAHLLVQNIMNYVLHNVFLSDILHTIPGDDTFHVMSCSNLVFLSLFN